MFTATTPEGSVTWANGDVSGDPYLVQDIKGLVDVGGTAAFNYWGERLATIQTEFDAYITIGSVLLERYGQVEFDTVPDNPDGYDEEGAVSEQGTLVASLGWIELYNHNHDGHTGRFSSGRNGVTVPAGTALHRGSVSADLHVSNDGESGPGVYLTTDHQLAAKYAAAKRSHGPSSAGAAVQTYRAARDLHILNRDTAEGEKEFRDIQTDPNTHGRLSGDAAIARFKAAGYDGVQYVSSGNEREITVHDPAHLTPTRGVDRTYPLITKGQARGDSRAVSEEEFQHLANIGRSQLEGFADRARKINLSDDQWAEIKRDANKEARQSWGGSTIDMHTGKPLPQGVNAYAITVKDKSTGKTISIPDNASKEEFDAAMDHAKRRFSYQLGRDQHYLGVFHDDAHHRIDFDPVLVVHNSRDVETIGAASHSIGGAYNFRDGNGYFPPHVDTSPTATSKRDDYVRTYEHERQP